MVTLLRTVWMAAVVLSDSRMALQDGSGSSAPPELRETMLPMPTQKDTARPVPKPATAPWKRQEKQTLYTHTGSTRADFNYVTK